MIKLSSVLLSVRDSRVDSLVYDAARDIDTVAHYIDIDPHYLSVQTRLHIPRFSETELFAGDGITPIRQVLRLLKHSLEHFAPLQRDHRSLNGIDALPAGSTLKDQSGRLWLVGDAGREVDLEFIAVDPDRGVEIQRHMHYIHSPRLDTKSHFGLAVSGNSAPICYASFSTLDREYLYGALIESGIADDVGMDRVAVMTRAFGYNPLPKNAMSKLFDLSCRQLSVDGFKYVITALNPFLGFRGSIFSGSSFVTFATSPMRYWYNNDGHYMNRRNSDTSFPQQYETPPILWLARALDSRRQREVDRFEGPLHSIGSESYERR